MSHPHPETFPHPSRQSQGQLRNELALSARAQWIYSKALVWPEHSPVQFSRLPRRERLRLQTAGTPLVTVRIGALPEDHGEHRAPALGREGSLRAWRQGRKGRSPRERVSTSARAPWRDSRLFPGSGGLADFLLSWSIGRQWRSTSPDDLWRCRCVRARQSPV